MQTKLLGIVVGARIASALARVTKVRLLADPADLVVEGIDE